MLASVLRFLYFRFTSIEKRNFAGHPSHDGTAGAETDLSEDEMYMGLLLAQLLLVTRANSQTISLASPISPAHLGNFQPTTIGCGIHPTLAFFNHSCHPNVVKVQQGRRTVVLAARRIRAGEEVVDNYGPLAFTCAGADRRSGQLGFTCWCTPCTQGWPQVTQKEN